MTIAVTEAVWMGGMCGGTYWSTHPGSLGWPYLPRARTIRNYPIYTARSAEYFCPIVGLAVGFFLDRFSRGAGFDLVGRELKARWTRQLNLFFGVVKLSRSGQGLDETFPVGGVAVALCVDADDVRTG